MSTFKITFAGGAQSVTGSNFLVEFGGKKVLIDCGLFQGEKIGEDHNRLDFSYDPSSIDALFVTHGHLDHVGRIPKLVKDGFKGTIYSTAPTRDIGELIMLDSMGILGKEAVRSGLLPMYEEKDVFNAMSLWKTVDYKEEIKMQASEGMATILFRDSGHILGSGIVVIAYKGKKLILTGDLGNTPSPLMRDTTPLEDVDYLVMESVYGDRNHEDYNVRMTLLKETIVNTIKQGGTLLIPAFSIERTQEMLLAFNNLVERGEIPAVPVYLDSPLGINITKVYKKYDKWFNDTVEQEMINGDDIFNFKGLVVTPTTTESKLINNVQGAKVIIAGSGMSNGGRIVHHEAHYLSDPKNTLLIVGFQAIGTLGRTLVDVRKKIGKKEVFINRQIVEVNAKIVNIHGFSAHKDSNHLNKYVGTADSKTLKKVFVVLGEAKSSYFLAQKIHETHGVEVVVPEYGDIVELE